MNNHFSKRVKLIIKYSKEEAARLHNFVIRPEHFMLGIIRDGEGKALDALSHAGVNIFLLKFNLENYLLDESKDDTKVKHRFEQEEKKRGNSKCETIVIDKASDRALKLSHLEARMLQSMETDSEHLLLAILKGNDNHLCELLHGYNVEYDTIIKQFSIEKNAKHKESNQPLIDDSIQDDEEGDEEDFDSYASGIDSMSKSGLLPKNSSSLGTPMLDSFGFDVTQAAEEGKLDPVVGRENEIERVAQILSRRKKNNPILIGEPGVGKSAIVEGLAQRIIQKKVSWLLFDKRVISLDLTTLVAGTKFRGQFEERIKTIMNELRNNKDIILFIDEIHTIVGAGGASGSMDAANILKPALSRGEFQCIGATTLDEFRKSFEKDGALERRFQKVIVEPTSAADTLTILQNIKKRYEEHHNVEFTDQALKACVTLTDRYVSDRNFPDKAIDALDETGSRMHIYSKHVPSNFEAIESEIIEVKQNKDKAILAQKFEEAASFRDKQRQLEAKAKEIELAWEEEQKAAKIVVDEDMIAEVVSQMSNIPIQKIATSESEKLLSLRSTLQSQIIGQDNAIDRIVKAIQRNRIGLKDPNRPIGTFLFLGPTGVGKTYLAKILDKEMFATNGSLIRIDMSEYMEKYSVSRLIGAPPGYVGYEEGGQLTERVRRHPYSVILFDEIEKANQEVFNLLLQVFDEGRLTDSLGRRVDFKNTIIIMTSNVGSRQLKDFGTGIGFSVGNAAHDKIATESVISKALGKTFSPEFLNRIDDIITFEHLDKPAIRKIIDIELKDFVDRIHGLGYELTLGDDVKDFLADKGYDKQFGARPLKRAIQHYIEDEMCEVLLQNIGKPASGMLTVSMPEPTTNEDDRKPLIAFTPALVQPNPDNA